MAIQTCQFFDRFHRNIWPQQNLIIDFQIQIAPLKISQVIHWPQCVKGWILKLKPITIYLINGNGLSYWLPLISLVANHLSYLLSHINQQDLIFWTNLASQYLITNLRQWAKCDKCDHSLPKLTHWGQVTHIYISNLTIIGSDIELPLVTGKRLSELMLKYC